MNRAEKTEWVKTFKEDVAKSQVVIFADYKGLTAVQADEIRKKIREKGGSIRVLKNNIARIAAKGGMGPGAEQVTDGLAGPTMVAFAYEDAAAIAKAIHEFSKDNEALAVRDGLMEGKRISPSDVEALASLPSREVLIAQLLGVLNGPARNFVSLLAAVPRGLVTVLSAIKDKKASSGEGS